MLFNVQTRPTLRSLRMIGACLTVILCTVYVLGILHRGWIPHDEGQLGQTAERILNGQLPHRDFVEPYTGGLGYLNALAFRCVGVRVEAMRWILIPFFAGFVASVFWITARATPGWIAAGAAFLCTCLTLPIYPAGMPSWYCLFLATYGTVALMRHIDTGRWGWLAAAGVCGGLSILVKITGLYFVAAGLLYIVYFEQMQRHENQDGQAECNTSPRHAWIFTIFVSVLLTVFASLGLLFIRGENPGMDVFHFGIPFLLLPAYLVWNEFSLRRGNSWERLISLTKRAVPFAVGVTIPVILFSIPYLLSHSVSDLFRGLFVLPAHRLSGANMAFPAVHTILFAVPLSALFALGFLSDSCLSRRITGPILVLLMALLCFSYRDSIYQNIFHALRCQLPLLVVLGLVTVIWRQRHSCTVPRKRNLELILLCAVTFLTSLVQFPYSGAYYFFYAAPLGVLLAVYVIAAQPHPPRRLMLGVLGFVTAFLVLRLHHPGPSVTAGEYAPQTPTAAVQLPRCNLTVRADQADLYRSLISTIQSHSNEGDYIYAAPDCPEVYFLAARRNPTRTFYDFIAEDDESDHRALLDKLQHCNVRVVVLKQFTEFSTGFDPRLIAELESRFEHRKRIASDRPDRREAFVVLW